MPCLSVRTRLSALLLGFLGLLSLPAPAGAQEVVSRGPHHTVYRGLDATGRPLEWTRLESGLNYWDTEAGAWRESVEEISLTPTGAEALHGHHAARFSSNANDPAGAVDLLIEQRTRLRSSVLALRYFDPVSGREAVLAVVQDARGELLPPNQVLYRNAFDRVRADLVYTYRRHGLEADVVLREMLPPPDLFGFPAETTRLEVLTEFFEAPEPVLQRRLLATVLEPDLRARMAEPDWFDEELIFGAHRIGDGRAFSWSAREAARKRPAHFPPVSKRWIRTPDQRRILVESVEFAALTQELLALPGNPEWRATLRTHAATWAGLTPEARRALGIQAPAQAQADSPPPQPADPSHLLPRRPQRMASLDAAAHSDRHTMLVATRSTTEPDVPGLVIDWATRGAPLANHTFAATQTYLVSGETWLDGTTTFEGGTVIKYRSTGSFTDPALHLTGPAVFKTSEDRPAFFTAASDDTLGVALLSDAAPAAAAPGWTALRFLPGSAPVRMRHAVFRQAHQGVVLQDLPDAVTLAHLQFRNCQFPVVGAATPQVSLFNVLIDTVTRDGTALVADRTTRFSGSHLTVFQAPTLATAESLRLTNSLIVRSGVPEPIPGEANVLAPSEAGIFQSAGGGHFYLAPNSPLRDAGVPLADPDLALELQQRTTVPPILFAHSSPQASPAPPRVARDVDAPDLGYHYAALDALETSDTTPTPEDPGSARIGTVTRSRAAAVPGQPGPASLAAGGARILQSFVQERTLEAVENPAPLFQEARSLASAPRSLALLPPPGSLNLQPADAPTGALGIWRLDEGSGLTASDGSGNGLDGQLQGATQWIAGASTNSLQFDGTSGLVSVPDSPLLQLTNALSVAFWVRKDTEATNWVRYVGKGASSIQSFGVWDWPGSSGRVMLQFINSSGAYVSLNSQREVPTNQWVHVAATWNGSSAAIYLNGTLDVSAPFSGFPKLSIDPLTFAWGGHHSPLGGALDEIHLYNRALSADEVAQLMLAALPPIPESGLVGHWRLDESSGSSALDASPNLLHGTLLNGAQRIQGLATNAIRFDGVNDSISIPDHIHFRLTNALSLAFWVRKESEPANWVRYVGKGSASVQSFGIWDHPGSSGRVMLQFINSSGAYVSLNSSRHVPPFVWTHIAATWNGTNASLYINGSLDVSGPFSGLPKLSSDPLTFAWGGHHSPLLGALDDIRLYNRSLDASAILALMSETAPPSPPGGLVGLWRLDESSGSLASDSSGNNLQGTWINSPLVIPGVSTNALEFDGLGERVSISDHPYLALTNGLSVAFWVKKLAEPANWVRYVGKGAVGIQTFGVWDWPGSSGRVMLQFINSSGAYVSLNSLGEVPTNQWVHIAATWNGATASIYLNGTLDRSGPFSGFPKLSLDPLTFAWGGHHSPLNGALDDVRLYNHALDSSAIAALAADLDPNRDPDDDGRDTGAEIAEGTNPLDPTSATAVRLTTWTFDNFSDPFRASNGSLPLVTNGVAVVPTVPGAAYGIDLDAPADRLAYPLSDLDGDVNTTFLQGTLRLAFAPDWGSDAPDCAPGTGPGETIDLVGVGPFALRIDARGTNLFFTTPNGTGGILTNVQANFRACSGDYDPEFPIEVQISYSTNATALFINGELVARGSGVVAAPDATARAAGVHFGSRADGTGQLRGILDSVVAYNIPLNLVTNPTSLAVSLQSSPQGVQLHWQGMTNWPHRVERRESGSGTWNLIASALPPRFTDTNLIRGRTYDYRLSTGVGLPAELLTTTDPGYLLARAGIAIEPADRPGRVLLVVDRTLTNDVAFADSIETLVRDLWSEGWNVARYDGPRHDDVTPANNPPLIAEVKGWITNQFAVAPDSTRAVLLLGHLPIPFSGMLSPDGHPYRPLPTDAYYGDVDGLWTDATNWLAAPNVAVPNLAGDGAFDQELVPPNPSGIAELEIPVGRIDLALLPAFAEATPARSELDLLNRYLAKARQYRRAEVTVPETLVAGAFFTSNLVQEAVHPYTIALKQFAARIRTAQYGTNVPAFAAQDFLTAGTPATWGLLGGFGNGPGGIHPNTVVNAFYGLTPRVTADLTATANQPPVAFSMIEASFASEWNVGNHLGRALLASETLGLSWSYAGAPRANWQLQGTFLNEPLSHLWRQTFNDAWQFPFVSTTLSNSFGSGVKVFTGLRSQGAYVYLASHGDPTLRPKPLAPVTSLSAVTNLNDSLTFQWTASALPNATYHVYRSTNGPGSDWTRLTVTALATNRFTDALPPAASRTYAVRVAALQSANSGTFTNLSAATLWP